MDLEKFKKRSSQSSANLPIMSISIPKQRKMTTARVERTSTSPNLLKIDSQPNLLAQNVPRSPQAAVVQPS